MKWLYAKLKDVRVLSITFIVWWLLLLLLPSLSSWCSSSTGGTAWEINDRRLACQNKVDYYTKLVEDLKMAEATASCNQL